MLMTPLHGVCEVVERSELEILGQVQVFYVLRPLDEPGLLKLPQKSLDAGVRPLLERADLESRLKEPMGEVEIPQLRPHQRLEAWLAALRQDDPMVRRRVLWQMGQVRSREKKLSPPEEQLGQRVKAAYQREIEMVLGVDTPTAERLAEESTC
jgi:RNA polymerase-interacting CarD/CdnL/TRCF family regulator